MKNLGEVPGWNTWLGGLARYFTQVIYLARRATQVLNPGNSPRLWIPGFQNPGNQPRFANPGLRTQVFNPGNSPRFWIPGFQKPGVIPRLKTQEFKTHVLNPGHEPRFPKPKFQNPSSDPGFSTPRTWCQVRDESLKVRSVKLIKSLRIREISANQRN